MQGNGNTAIPIPMEDGILHTTTCPFCFQPSCICHEDQDNIAEVNQHVLDGLLTSDEATDFVNGKMFH